MNRNPLSGVLGQALSLSWRAVTSRLLAVVVILFVATILLFSIPFYLSDGAPWAEILFSFLAYGVMRATITSAIYSLEQNGTVEAIRTTLRQGLESTLPLLLVELLILAPIFLLFSLLSPLAGTVLLSLLGIDGSIFLGILVTFALCLYLYCRVALAPVQVVVDADSRWALIKVIKNSWDCTRGFVFSIWLRLIVASLAYLIIALPGLLMSVLSVDIGGGNFPDTFLVFLFGGLFLMLLAMIFVPIFQFSVLVLLYRRLADATPGAHSTLGVEQMEERIRKVQRNRRG